VRFSVPSSTFPRPTKLSLQWIPALLRGKGAGAWC